MKYDSEDPHSLCLLLRLAKAPPSFSPPLSLYAQFSCITPLPSHSLFFPDPGGSPRLLHVDRMGLETRG